MQTFEYLFLLRELQPLLGRRFSKIYDLGPSQFRLKFGDRDLFVQLGQCLHLARQLPTKLPALSPFSQKVRKELEGRRLERIELINQDRIVVFRFGGLELVFEMFGAGNALLVQQGGILSCHHSEQWKGRTLKAGLPYAPPPSPPIRLADSLSSRYVASDLAKLPYGTLYAKEALARCRIAEQKPGNALSEAERVSLEKTLSSLFSEAQPRIFYSGERPVDFGLLPFATHGAYTFHPVPTISEAVETCRLAAPAPISAEIGKLSIRLQKQEEALQQAREQEKQAKEAADFIYAHPMQIQEILDLANAGKWEELRKCFSPLTIDKKKKEIALALPD